VFNYILQGERLGEGHTKAAHEASPHDLAARSIGRVQALPELMQQERWCPEYPDDWPSLWYLERPRHAVLDDGNGEPLFTR
jgi:hypothetical protein